MARIRTVKPEFWTDEKVVTMSPLARLLFIGMWNFVDDEGRAEYSPTRLKMQILPADSADISELLGEIREKSLITVYSLKGKDFFEVRGFKKHQKVDHRTQSKIDPPPNSTESPRNVPPDQGREGIKEGKGKKEDNNPVSLKNGSGRYAFEFGVVKLAQPDLDKWIEAFPNVSVKAELTGAEPWLAKEKNWFQAAAGLLAKRQRESKNLSKQKSGEPDMYYDSGAGWVDRNSERDTSQMKTVPPELTPQQIKAGVK